MAADFMGYHSLSTQETENKEVLTTSCNTIKELLDLIGS
jgi:hypothetical protein